MIKKVVERTSEFQPLPFGDLEMLRPGEIHIPETWSGESADARCAKRSGGILDEGLRIEPLLDLLLLGATARQTPAAHLIGGVVSDT